jgi:inner membrane transporter RhtA
LTAPRDTGVIVPVAVLVAAIVSFQGGAALAKSLFPLVGASGAAALRLMLATVMLFIVWRPWRLRPSGREWAALCLYGAALGLMNFLFYSALRTIPLGIAVALEFTGPLAVAMAASRRRIDFLWVALAAFGIVMLLGVGEAARPLEPWGVACALGAGVFWALYIVFGQRAGGAHGGPSAALGMLVGALIIAPIGVAEAGFALFSPSLLPVALGVALLSSALPYSLEMFALTRLPTRTFGVLMSLDPAFGALSGLCFLREHLSAVQWLAIAAIMLASGGSAATSRVESALQIAE